MTNLSISKVRIWNVSFNKIDLECAVDTAINSINAQLQVSVAFVNPHSQVVASKDHSFRRALESFSLVLADGIGTIIGSQLVGERLPGRISGPSFFKALSDKCNCSNRPVRYFFLGSTQKVLDNIAAKMSSEWPGISMAGIYAPPMGDFSKSEEEQIIDVIRSAKPDVLWVGMTAPKQEKWIAQYAPQTEASVIAGIGAEFDYFAGTKKRPPVWISKCGLQWLHRFVQEPRRTWRRHIISAPLFLLNTWRSRKIR